MKYKTSHQAEACLRTGHIYKVDQETNNIDEDQISPDIWQEVDAADLAEVRQFVEEKAFKKLHTSAITSDMVVPGGSNTALWTSFLHLATPHCLLYKWLARVCETWCFGLTWLLAMCERISHEGQHLETMICKFLYLPTFLFSWNLRPLLSRHPLKMPMRFSMLLRCAHAWL